MRKLAAQIKQLHIIPRAVSIALVSTVILCTALVQILLNRNSVAYLYDESDVAVDYSIAKLSFDLSSNHMYSYYTESATYTGIDKFESVLTTLSTAVTSYDSGTTTMESFNTTVKNALKNYYDEAMIDSLQDAWDTYEDQDEYNDAVRAVYNSYYQKYEYMFKIKNILLSSVSGDKGIWYYYAKDLIDTYLTEYVVQHDATGVSQSTMKIGIKLKGGTTYSSYQENDYYDEHFNDMVTAYTMDFQNTGNVNLYLNFALDMAPVNNDSKGVLGMVLPYGMTWETLLTDSNYSTFFNTITSKWNFHSLIKALLLTKSASYTAGTVTGMDNTDTYGTLTYSSLEEMLKVWNEYAIGTYSDTSQDYINDNKNFYIVPNSDRPAEGELQSVKVSMLFWADYQKNAEYYAETLTDNLNWRTDDTYKLIQYFYNVNIKTSLKNSDMSLLTVDDWEMIYNKQKEYDKYAGVSNFDVEGYAYFETVSGGATIRTNAKNYMQSGYIICNYINPSEINYISNLRFNVQYRGYSPAYLRVRFSEQFTNTMGEIVAVNQLKFNLGNSWVDNRVDDLYFYSNKMFYSTETATQTASGKAKVYSIPVITGLDGQVSEIDEMLTRERNMILKINFYVEAVQPNRIEAYWGKTIEQIDAMY